MISGLISGEYNINYDKYDNGERTMELNLVIVTAEDSENNSENFMLELEALLRKYAI